MREMKDSRIEWIGAIPADWEIIRTKNKFRSHKDIAGSAAESYERLALTLNGVIKRSKEDSTGLQPEAFNGYQILRAGELVFKLIDLENISTSRVGLSAFTGIVSPAYIVLTPSNGINSSYAQYFFLSMWQREVFNHMGDDGVRSSLNAKDLLNIPLTYPSLAEQERIAAFLDRECSEIDALISRTRDSIAEYKKLKQAVITKTVTLGVKNSQSTRCSQYEWIGEYPAHWREIKIKWLLQERKDRSETGDEEPLSMSQKYGLIPTKDMDRVPNMAATFVGAKLVYRGDLVFNKLKAHLGVFAVSEYDGLVSPDYAVYYPSGVADMKFLEYLFKTPQYIAEFRKKSSGVGAGLTRLVVITLTKQSTRCSKR